jgi:phage head maturation protease
MERIIELPRQARLAEVRAASFNTDDNTIDVIWTTGATVRRRSWIDGPYDEVLAVTPEAVRLDRLNAGAPFLNTHSDWDLSDVIGAVVPGTAKIVKGQGIATVRLSSAPGDADNVQKIRDGIVRNVSVGYLIHRIEKTESDDGTVPVWNVVDWEPMEISAVPIPADAGSQIRSDEADKTRLFNCVISERGAAEIIKPAPLLNSIRTRMRLKAHQHELAR